MKYFNTRKVKLNGNNISKKYLPKVLIGILILSFFFFAVLTLMAFSKPMEVQEKVQNNLVKQNFSYSLKADVIPCTLYPKGGIITPEGSIISNVTKALVIDLDAKVTGEKPVTVNASEKVTISLVGENMWDWKYLQKSSYFKGKESLTNDLFQNKFTIRLADINYFIKKVEKELQNAPSRYLLKIKPEIKGNVTSGNTAIPLEMNSDEITIEYYPNGQIQLLKSDGSRGSNAQNAEDSTFNKEVPVYSVSVTMQKLNLFGINIPLSAARYIFLPIALLLFAFLTIIYADDSKKKKKQMTESQWINKKYKSRIISVQSGLEESEKAAISVESFKLLIRIADERELTILKLDNDANTTTYFIVDSGCTYKYLADNTFNSDFKIYSTGSGLYNEQ
jgi:hypothetical protein